MSDRSPSEYAANRLPEPLRFLRPSGDSMAAGDNGQASQDFGGVPTWQRRYLADRAADATATLQVAMEALNSGGEPLLVEIEVARWVLRIHAECVDSFHDYALAGRCVAYIEGVIAAGFAEYAAGKSEYRWLG